MKNEALTTYLNDHLAGSVIALELLDLLVAERDGTADESALVRLHAEITEDRETLKALMAQLTVETSRPRQAMAWLTEKLSEAKLRLDDPGRGALRRLEALEAVAVGIAGKQALWRTLAATADDTPEPSGLDYGELLRRAADQSTVVERLRLDAAREAFIEPFRSASR